MQIICIYRFTCTSASETSPDLKKTRRVSHMHARPRQAQQAAAASFLPVQIYLLYESLLLQVNLLYASRYTFCTNREGPLDLEKASQMEGKPYCPYRYAFCTSHLAFRSVQKPVSWTRAAAHLKPAAKPSTGLRQGTGKAWHDI
jgi:hypothetical protein